MAGKELEYMGGLDLSEMINGESIIGPSPFCQHQNISRALFSSIDKYLQENPLGKVFYAPLDVILEEGQNRVQPDLLFIKNENLGIAQDWIRGVPDLVIEIVSQGSVAVDTVIKKGSVRAL